MSSPKEFLTKLYNNLQLLQEREANYGSFTAPLWLINQIEHYQKAIDLTEQAIEQNISAEGLQTEFTSLNLEIRDTIEFKSARKPYDGRNPYRGLEKFTEHDCEFFFGSAAVTAELVAMTQALLDKETSGKNPALLSIIGASGSGKSSLVQAGLIPALREGHIPNSETWPIRVIFPGPKLIEALAETFVKLTGRGMRSILDDLHRDEQGLYYLIKEALAGKEEKTYLTLVIDQFEELFTLCEREEERQDFIKLLLYEATHRYHCGLTILIMRADFYERASQYPQLAQTLTVHQMLVAPMTQHELREAILLPAEEVGLEMEKELALALVQDTVNEPGALTLLQHSLLELFNRKTDDHVLTMAAYQEIGGVRGALAHRADSILAGLEPQQRELARNIFLRLTTLGEGVSDTRRRVNRQELYPAGVDPEAIDTVLQTLSSQEARLVVTDKETVEVTHEALIQQWGQLRMWLEENRDSLHIHRRVTEAAREWETTERDDSYLFRGARLAEAEAWVAEHGGELTPNEWAFISAGIAEQEREANEEGGILSVAFSPDGPTLASGGGDNTIRLWDLTNLEAEPVILRGHEGLVWSVAFSPDGATLASGGDDDTIHLWNMADSEAEPTIFRGHEGGIRVVAFSPDGTILASGSGAIFTLTSTSRDSTIRLWKLADLEAEPIILRGHEEMVYSLAFSSDGTTLASAGSADGTIRLWNLSDPKADPTVLRGHERRVDSVVFSPDGTILASAGQWEPTIYLWDLVDPTTDPTVLPMNGVWSVVFSPDAITLAAGGYGGAIHLWNMADSEAEPTIFRGHENQVNSLAFQ